MNNTQEPAPELSPDERIQVEAFGLHEPTSETTSGPTRAEHLAWCKARALQYVDAGDVENAFASMISDLNKHPDTEGHAGAELGLLLLLSGRLSSAQQMREFIERFN